MNNIIVRGKCDTYDPINGTFKNGHMIVVDPFGITRISWDETSPMVDWVLNFYDGHEVQTTTPYNPSFVRALEQWKKFVHNVDLKPK